MRNEELAAVWEAAGKIKGFFGDAVRLLILTGSRREEIGGLRWSEINGETFYEPAEKSKSELYVDLLPLINSGAVDLLDHDRLVMQMTSLERRTSRGGKDSIDHAPGAHDDIANAVAGALVTAFKESQVPNFNREIVFPPFVFA